MSRPRLLDLFSGAGGCAVGYDKAGFEVIGVDIVAQPRYPFEHHVADALSILRGMIGWPYFNGEMWRPNYFAAIHASPPCKDHTALANLSGGDGTGWMLAATRDLLAQIGERDGTPWVIENVPGAPLRSDLILCGEMFGLGVRRHRLFETEPSLFSLLPPCQHDQKVVSVHGQPGGTSARDGVLPNLSEWKAAMGIDWMSSRELSQAIPPAYTEHIGTLLLERIGVPA